MDAERFDRIAMLVGRAAGRRAVVRLLLGGVVGALAPGRGIALGRQSCAPPCGEDEGCCSTGCQFLGDDSHCGACDAACRDGEMCQQCKVYEPDASEPYDFCTAGPANERYRCCPVGQHNSNGRCCQAADPTAVNCCTVADEVAGLCEAECISLTGIVGPDGDPTWILVNDKHCRTCGNACSRDKRCVAGACECKADTQICDDGICRQCCQQNHCEQDHRCCDGFCCPQTNAICHTTTGACCVPDPDTCGDRCGEVVNNCGVTVDCGPCECNPPCPACRVCNNALGRCERDPAQVGKPCGGSLACSFCSNSGLCEPCAGCCANGACVASCGACQICVDRQCVPCPGCCRNETCVASCGDCQICEDGQCLPCPNCCLDGACVAACGACQSCENGQCVPCPGCCADGVCVASCGPCQACVNEQCRPCPGCCVNGTCVASCGNCQICSDGQCVTGSCCNDADCPAGSGKICPPAELKCRCPAGKKECGDGCIPNSSCCSTVDCRPPGNRICSGPGGYCTCPTGQIPCGMNCCSVLRPRCCQNTCIRSNDPCDYPP